MLSVLWSQGEDVSMGIWMAAVGPQRHQVDQLHTLLVLTERLKSVQGAGFCSAFGFAL